jgi:hypothetical protein
LVVSSSKLIPAFEIPNGFPTDYTQYTKNPSFRGLRLGVPRNVFFNVTYVEHQEIIDAANVAIQKMAVLGAIIQDAADLPSAEELIASSSEITILRTIF